MILAQFHRFTSSIHSFSQLSLCKTAINSTAFTPPSLSFAFPHHLPFFSPTVPTDSLTTTPTRNYPPKWVLFLHGCLPCCYCYGLQLLNPQLSMSLALQQIPPLMAQPCQEPQLIATDGSLSKRVIPAMSWKRRLDSLLSNSSNGILQCPVIVWSTSGRATHTVWALDQ